MGKVSKVLLVMTQTRLGKVVTFEGKSILNLFAPDYIWYHWAKNKENFSHPLLLNLFT